MVGAGIAVTPAVAVVGKYKSSPSCIVVSGLTKLIVIPAGSVWAWLTKTLVGQLDASVTKVFANTADIDNSASLLPLVTTTVSPLL